MLTARAWNLFAVVRLLLCVAACFVCGSLLAAMLHHVALGREEDLRLYRMMKAALGCLAISFLFAYRPWTPDNWIFRLIVSVVLFYAGFAFGVLAQPHSAEALKPSISFMVVAALSLQGATLILIPHFLQEQRLTWHEAFGFRHDRRRAFILGIIVACVFLPIGMGLQWLSAQVMLHLPQLHLQPQEQESVQTLEMAVTWFNRLALGAITVVLAPAAEEMLFRGILYPAIKQAGFPRLACWGTALLFAAVHQNLVTFVPLTVLALALIWLYERTDNLWAPITAHAMFNAMNFVILYSTLGPPTRIK
ncbi:MAG TPA: type II CAAX endopeptidase family protein [Verrucomicrobiae bacterium]|nr:type II CAAX endopeptidase family protein [Verrucomicrobiae bacterium]